MADVITTSFDAQDALYAALLARKALPGNPLQSGVTPAGVEITLGGPGTYEKEHVWIAGDIEPYTSDYQVSGLETKDETYELRVHIIVTRQVRTYVEVRDRAKVILREIERAVASDVFLGGCPITLASIARYQVEEAIPSEQPMTRQVLLSVWVRVRALAGMAAL